MYFFIFEVRKFTYFRTLFMLDIASNLMLLPGVLLGALFVIITGIHVFRKIDTASVLMFVGALINVISSVSMSLVAVILPSRADFNVSDLRIYLSVLGIMQSISWAVFLVGLGLRLLKK